MAVPKRKQTPSRTGMRRSQNMKFSSKNVIEDKNCLLYTSDAADEV